MVRPSARALAGSSTISCAASSGALPANAAASEYPRSLPLPRSTTQRPSSSMARAPALVLKGVSFAAARRSSTEAAGGKVVVVVLVHMDCAVAVVAVVAVVVEVVLLDAEVLDVVVMVLVVVVVPVGASRTATSSALPLVGSSPNSEVAGRLPAPRKRLGRS